MMAFDIYGNVLRPGHCEVHPDVAEPYPCWYCRAESSQAECCRSGACEVCSPGYRWGGS